MAGFVFEGEILMTTFEDEPVFPCADRCPYRIGEQVDELVATEHLGVLVVRSASIDRKLREYQTRDCAGAEEWDADGTFCPGTNQAYNAIDQPGVRVRDAARELDLLKRHHSSLWEATLQHSREQSIRNRQTLLGKLRDGIYTPEQIVLARHKMEVGTARGFNSSRLTEAELNKLYADIAEIDDIIEAVGLENELTIVKALGKTEQEALQAIVENDPKVEHYAEVQFRMRVYEISDKPWF